MTKSPFAENEIPMIFQSTFGLEVAWSTKSEIPEWGELFDFPASTPWTQRDKSLTRVPFIPYRSGSWFRSLAALKKNGTKKAVVFISEKVNPDKSPLRTSIVINEANWIFVPVYKSGYSSFRAMAFSTFQEFENFDRKNSASLNQLINPQKEGYTSFSFVREPFSRFKSFYKDKVLVQKDSSNDINFSQPIAHLAEGKSLHDIANFVSAIPDSHSDPHWRSQHSTLTFRGELLVDHLYTLSRSQDALSELWKSNHRSAPQFPHVLSTQSRPLDDPTEHDAFDVISSKYINDFSLYRQIEQHG